MKTYLILNYFSTEQKKEDIVLINIHLSSFLLYKEIISKLNFYYLQNLCLPIVTVIGLDHIHLLVAVEGLK